MKTYIHTYENIIIGGSLEALKFAYSSGYPVLCIPQKPHFFCPKSVAKWEHLAFVLSLSGGIPLWDSIASIRVDPEAKEIKCFTTNSRVIRFSYEKAYILDDLGVEGLPVPTVLAKKEYLVFDWISVKRGGNHPYDYIEDEDSLFVRRLQFYPSRRATYDRGDRKDACAISIMTDKQLKNNGYSESYVLLKSREMMKDAGLKGSRNGTQAYNGKPAYLSIKIEVAHRDTRPLHKNQYEDTESLKFFPLDVGEIKEYNKYLEYFLGMDDGRGKARGSKNPSRQAEV